MTSTAWLDRIRSDFPALRDATPAFFDGPGGTQVPSCVLDAVGEYLARRNANTHGAFATSQATEETLRGARERFAWFLGGGAEEIVFGANMTTLTFAVSRALAREWSPGDEVIVTELDHQANVAPWRVAAEERGAVVRSVPFHPETLQLDLEAFERLLSARTRLVAVGAASNAVGTINDVARIARLAREAGALCYVDAVHFAPHRLVDVAAMGCDFLVCSAYKFFGPHVGILWGRRELLERIRPYKVPPAPDTAPERWETGTLNHEGIAGAAAAVDWIAGLATADRSGAPGRAALQEAWRRVEEHERALFERLRERLAGIPGLRLFGPPAGSPRTPTAAFTLEGHTADAVATRLAAAGVYVWNGDFYASTVVTGLGLGSDGLVRAGLAAYSSVEDVERLTTALAALAAAAA